MKPNNDQYNPTNTPNDQASNQGLGRSDTYSRPIQPPARNSTTDAQRDAAADITRGQISRIYERDSPYKDFEDKPATTNASEPAAQDQNSPYNKTHSPESQLSATDHFRQYHTAWQDYYQKYYEGYYTQAVRQTQEQLRLRAEMGQSQPSAVFGAPAAAAPQADTPASATHQLQSRFKKKIGERAKKVRHSKHFWPLITAISVGVLFLFLQYNSLLIANVAAFVSPGTVDPANIIVDPTTDTKVGPDPKLIIPKINVDAPVDYSVTTYSDSLIEAALKNGVVKYAIPGADANPGQVGNLVIGGHSSNDVFDDGNYKFVFVQLEKMSVGDTIYLNYQGTRYTYHVTKTATIAPNQISALTQTVSTPTLTLVTCTPVGTAINRFIVTAEQVSPDPSTAGAATSTASGSATSIPGNSPTVLEQIFGS